MSESLGPCLENVLLAMIVADEDVDPDEVAAAEQAYDEVIGHALPDGELAQKAADAKRTGQTPAAFLKCIPRDLEAGVQQQFLAAAFKVASADGFVLEEEDELLQAVAKALGMDESQSRTAIAGLMG